VGVRAGDRYTGPSVLVGSSERVTHLDNNTAVSEQGHQAAGVTPGQILLGKYRIERVLGMGGMGVVVAATHVTLEERVAIKFLLPQALSNGEAVARFLREARAAVRIKSEHVARVTDVGQLENGAPYMIMEYLDGSDLGTLAQHRGALPIEEAVEYVLQACEAIAEAHALGIVHRDLKPANLFVVTRADGTPSVKVLDFGISKVTGMSSSGADLGMTKTTTIMGSPLYMSPEQMASSRDVDARTDIWALGAILYELLAGTVPFRADTITQLCVMILQQPAPSLRNVRPDAPEGLQQVITRCLDKDRTRRYTTVADFAHALAPFAPKRARLSIERVSRVIEGAGLGGSQPNLDDAMPPSSRVGTTGAAWGATGEKRGSGKVIGLVLALLLLGGAATAAVLVLKPHGPAPAPTVTTEPGATGAPNATVTPTATEAPKIEPVTPPAGTATATAPTASASAPASPTTTAVPVPAVAKGVFKGKGGKPQATAQPPAPPPPQPAPPPPAPPKPPPAKKVNLYDDRK
jgi:serine/threonine protein kinase